MRYSHERNVFMASMTMRLKPSGIVCSTWRLKAFWQTWTLEIANMTPADLEAEAQNDAALILTSEFEAELDAALSVGAESEKKYWFAQQRKKRRRGRR